MDRTYVCIDLKSYYASAELADRKYNPLTTNLVVADLTRTEKTICLSRLSPHILVIHQDITLQASLLVFIGAVRLIHRTHAHRPERLRLPVF